MFNKFLNSVDHRIAHGAQVLNGGAREGAGVVGRGFISTTDGFGRRSGDTRRFKYYFWVACYEEATGHCIFRTWGKQRRSDWKCQLFRDVWQLCSENTQDMGVKLGEVAGFDRVMPRVVWSWGNLIDDDVVSCRKHWRVDDGGWSDVVHHHVWLACLDYTATTRSSTFPSFSSWRRILDGAVQRVCEIFSGLGDGDDLMDLIHGAGLEGHVGEALGM